MSEGWAELQALIAKLTKVAAIAQTLCADYIENGEIFTDDVQRLREALDELRDETQ